MDAAALEEFSDEEFPEEFSWELPGDFSEEFPELADTIKQSTRAYDGRFAKVDLLDVVTPDGKASQREVLRHPGAVCLIVLSEDASQILLERQYRVAIDKVIIEIPAGKIDPGEEPSEAAVRELREETGFAAAAVEHLIDMVPAVGYSDEILHFFKAQNLTSTERDLDEGEFIDTFWMDVDEFCNMATNGEIIDSKTLLAALMLACGKWK